MHKLDLANFPVTETLKMLASLLEKITSANDQLKSSHSVSHSETSSSSSTAVTTTPSFTLYFDRMSKNASASNSGKRFSIDSFNIHRLIIAGIMVSSKFFSDVFFTNSRYAKVGGLPVSELNQLELEFLILNDFRLAITVDELQRYGDQLLKHWTMEEGSRQGGSIYENMRYPNGIGVNRWDSGMDKNNAQYKRTRRLHSIDDSNTSKGGGSKAIKEEEQSENYRSHRRENSFSSTRSLNIPYQSSLTSSPQQYSTHLSKTPPPGSSPSTFTSTLGGPHPPSINGSPMNSPFTHHPHYHHLHKQYPHHQSQHHRSVSLGSTIKRANSSGSLLSRARDLSEDLHQYHQRHSSPKPMNPEEHVYRNAAPSPYYPGTSIPSSSISSNGRGGPQNLVTPSPTHKITNLMRRMSHDSPANLFQYPTPSAYHYTAYPPPSTQSLPTTPVSTLPPPSSSISFNPAAIGSVTNSAAVAALGYARRASLVLPPLPRHLGLHNNVSSSISTVAPENIGGSGLVRRGSIPSWNGCSLSNGGNGNGGNGPSSLLSSVSTNPVNGSGSPSTELTRKGSWVMVTNHSQSNNSSIGQHNINNHVHQLNHQHNNHNYHAHQHIQRQQNHGSGNKSRSSSSDSSHSSSTTGSASDTSGSPSIAVSRGATNDGENRSIDGTNKTLDN
ncbi:15334_t:CDS:2 [Acaulospora colombiana]|uniref:15334_t:CDS:1 n=1 Tax=Acaulospora colombiana TaxID=27376 RepID=A0ACA9LZ08_9GLOM|nr:15334_t:CDS:2 [Acaulospora colombiana]